MSFTKIWITHLLIAIVAITLCGGPHFAQAQQQQTTQQQTQQTPTNPAGKVDPSRAPLSPVPSQQLPDSPSAQQDSTQQPPQQPAPQQPKTRPVSPVGVAAAEAQPTAGGAASKPAGNAIAPAKQKQYRSLIIKLGAIAGAGIAIGTVYALTKGTKSTPPGAVR